MNSWLFSVALFALVALTCGNPEARRGSRVANVDSEPGADRREKAFNILQIIRFPNDPCMGTGTRNGTCYTADECEDRSGTSAGTCASGFGVCCMFTVGCGGTTSENCTYFEASNPSAGGCNAQICPCNDNICQLRLDFDMFVITGPTTSSVSNTQIKSGVAIAGGAPSVTQGQCLTDAFAVTNPGGNAPSVICGTNTGEHMYVDSSDNCNMLNFNFGTTTMATRMFSIKVTQISCSSELLAPDGCTQYFFGAATGTVESFNFNSANGQHLANQNQAICFRRERGMCRTCFSATTTADFMLSGKTTVSALSLQTMCGQFGVDGVKTMGFDFVAIPRAESDMGVRKNDRVCGRKKIDATDGTRCTTMQPFMVRFRSDSTEHSVAMSEAVTPDVGFRLGFFMDAINCGANN